MIYSERPEGERRKSTFLLALPAEERDGPGCIETHGPRGTYRRDDEDGAVREWGSGDCRTYPTPLPLESFAPRSE